MNADAHNLRVRRGKLWQLKNSSFPEPPNGLISHRPIALLNEQCGESDFQRRAGPPPGGIPEVFAKQRIEFMKFVADLWETASGLPFCPSQTGFHLAAPAMGTIVC